MSAENNPLIVVAQLAIVGLVAVTFAGALYGFPTEWAIDVFVGVFIIAIFGAIGYAVFAQILQ